MPTLLRLNSMLDDLIPYSKARALAEAWVDIFTDGRCALMDEVVKKPYGWIFHYQSKDFIQSHDIRDMLIGTGPLIVDRLDGNLTVRGSGRSLEDDLSEYEALLPKSRLRLPLPDEPNDA